jgi:hypothetical protein
MSTLMLMPLINKIPVNIYLLVACWEKKEGVSK